MADLSKLKQLETLNNAIKAMPYSFFTIKRQKSKFLFIASNSTSLCRLHLTIEDFIFEDLETDLTYIPATVYKIIANLKKFSTFLNKQTADYKKTFKEMYALTDGYTIRFLDDKIDGYYDKYLAVLTKEAIAKQKAKEAKAKTASNFVDSLDEEDFEDDEAEEVDENLVLDIRKTPLFTASIHDVSAKLPSILKKPDDGVLTLKESYDVASLIEQSKQMQIQSVGDDIRIAHKHLPTLNKLETLSVEIIDAGDYNIVRFTASIAKVMAMAEVFKVSISV